MALPILMASCRPNSKPAYVSGTIETDEVRVASRYGYDYYDYGYPYHFGFGIGFGYPYGYGFYDPFYNPFCYGSAWGWTSRCYGYGYGFGFGYTYYRPRPFFRPRPYVFGRPFIGVGLAVRTTPNYVIPRDRSRFASTQPRPRSTFSEPRIVEPRAREVPRVQPRGWDTPRPNVSRGSNGGTREAPSGRSSGGRESSGGGRSFGGGRSSGGGGSFGGGARPSSGGGRSGGGGGRRH